MTAELDAQLRELSELAGRIAAAHGGSAHREARRRIDAAFESARPASAPSPVADRSRFPGIIGDSPAILDVLAIIERVAASNIPVLIQGESGTGKELIARAIHEHSARHDKPFVSENCAAIPETLLESELFGYKKGAFTGADRERKGLFQVADKGTLFLDEVGDMSLSMQKKLLRVLQDGEIRPVGGTVSFHVDVRIVSASNRLLKDLSARNLFREDLYFRLSGVTIELPPLRERADDVPRLAEFFLSRISAEMKRPPPVLTVAASDALMRHRWPGNIRELENEIRRCLALLGAPGENDAIGPEHLSDEVRAAAKA